MVPYDANAPVADDRGGDDRNRRERRVVPIDLGRRDRHDSEEFSDQGALEGVPMLDRVTGGGPRVTHSPNDPPRRSRSHEPASRNPWTGRHRGRLSRPGRSKPATAGSPCSPNAFPGSLADTSVAWPQTRSDHRAQDPDHGAFTRGNRPRGAGALLLVPGRPAVKQPRPPVASTRPGEASGTSELLADKRVISFSLERLLSQGRAAQRRRRGSLMRQRTRVKTHHALVAAHTDYAAAASTSTASTVASSPTSSVQSSAPTSASSTPAGSSSSSASSGGSSKQNSTSSKQPAFGSSGTLGPGSSPYTPDTAGDFLHDHTL